MKIRTNSGIFDYDGTKVKRAVEKAFETSGNVIQEDVLIELEQQVKARLVQLAEIEDTVDKVTVLDTIEKVLMTRHFYEVAVAFIHYRFQHILQKDLLSKSEVHKVINKYLDRSDININENANQGYSLMGMNNNIVRAATESYWLDKIYSEEVAAAHKDGYIHAHDLDQLCVYCCGWDLQDLLLRGFGGVTGKIQCAPPKHLDSALGQIYNFIYTMTSEAAGAQAISSFDTFLAPFISEEGLTYKQVRQKIQAFIFNMNVPTRIGGQAAFSNITLDITVPKHMKDQPTIIGGKFTTHTFGEYQKEMDMLNKALFEVMGGGDAQGRIFTFPIPTINIGPSFDWANPTLNGLWEITAQYGIPYFANFLNSDLNPEDARSMCCRLRLDVRELQKRGGGLFGANPLTGSLGVITISLPILAYEANGSVDRFYTLIDKYMGIGKTALETKRKVLEKFMENDLYPYSKFYLGAVKTREGKYWTNHFSTIGLIGMYEAAKILGIDYPTEDGKQFAERTLDFMNAKILKFQKETGNFYNLEATPAEGASYKLALKARRMYPKIPTAGIEIPYFTNSTMLPVEYTTDIFKVLEHQSELQSKYTGGSVTHVFLGERSTGSQVKALVKKIFTTYKLPYLSITPTFSICPTHGYLSGEHKDCPKCKEEQVNLQNKLTKLQSDLKAKE